MLTVGKKVCLYNAHSKHELQLKECGLKLSLPEGIISPAESAVYEVAAQGLWGGEFIFPEGTQLISGVCYISLSPSELAKPATVQLSHCAHITSKSQAQYLSFVVAESSRSPFKFEPRSGGMFPVGSRYGSIQLERFSVVAIVMGLAAVGFAAAGVAAGVGGAIIAGAVAGGVAGLAVGGGVIAAATQRGQQQKVTGAVTVY